MRKRFIFLICGILLTSGCSSNEDLSSKSEADTGSITDTTDNKVDDVENPDENEISSSNGSSDLSLSQERKVIFNANLSLTVEDLPQAIDKLNQFTNSFKGYIVEASTYTEDETVIASMTVRIPQNKFNSFLDKAEAIGKGTPQKSITGSDVTEEYIDFTSRLKAKETVRKRLEDFLKEA
ncbi:DUF4349 domain-containing protein [Pseudalkalibacillus hwajinpoensis]|uniref:DUF4349 domain-containing protein n=1 Tax=Guptibacillus hwajinpoensis TaxID=208199 RepID=UPI00325AF484